MASGASGDPSPPAPVPSDEEEGVEKVEPGDLSDELMKCKLLRKRIKEKGFMTRWVVKEAIGILSVKAMSLNYVALEYVARWHCPQHPYPKMVPVDLLRKEASHGILFDLF
jgi:hypothetical protein